jgi:hypothetical protein
VPSLAILSTRLPIPIPRNRAAPSNPLDKGLRRLIAWTAGSSLGLAQESTTGSCVMPTIGPEALVTDYAGIKPSHSFACPYHGITRQRLTRPHYQEASMRLQTLLHHPTDDGAAEFSSDRQPSDIGWVGRPRIDALAYIGIVGFHCLVCSQRCVTAP